MEFIGNGLLRLKNHRNETNAQLHQHGGYVGHQGQRGHRSIATALRREEIQDRWHETNAVQDEEAADVVDRR